LDKKESIDMPTITEVNIRDLLIMKGRERTDDILSSFMCDKNKDIETYLHDKAIDFSNQYIAGTHLLFCEHDGHPVLAGYFALAMKNMFIKEKDVPSNSRRKRLEKFGDYFERLGGFIIPAPLIAQLGKNDLYSGLDLITGRDILNHALQHIAFMQKEFSGKMAFLECEDNLQLTSFYESNGFLRSSTSVPSHYTDELIQMVRYL
jgi:hypothetical protein